jgi:VanZ family protein
VLKNIFLFAALSWTFIILILCLASFNNLPSTSIQNADKYVHFIFHFVFVILWFLYYNIKVNTSIIKKISTLFLVSLFFGIVIEIAQQNLTITRKADFFDFLANSAGAFSATLLILIIGLLNKKK